MYTLDFHGDDYGISKNNCIRFVELMKAGKIDSISVIPNMSYFEDGMKYLHEQWDSIEHKPKISVHINIMDGYSLGGVDDTRLVKQIEEKNILCASWVQLFICSYLPIIRRKMRRELKEEIRAQIERVYRALPDGCRLRLDSHQHTHMVPIVFDAMMDAISELGVINELEFVRVSREPLMPFLKVKGVKGTYSIVNVVKNVLLSILSSRAERRLSAKGIQYGCLWGLVMTGRMDNERVKLAKQAVCKWLDERTNRGKSDYMEVLCHPGLVLPYETSVAYSEDDLHAFFSENRDVEYDMLMKREN